MKIVMVGTDEAQGERKILVEMSPEELRTLIGRTPYQEAGKEFPMPEWALLTRRILPVIDELGAILEDVKKQAEQAKEPHHAG